MEEQREIIKPPGLTQIQSKQRSCHTSLERNMFFLDKKPKSKDDDENDNLTVGNRLPLFSDHLISFPRDFFLGPLNNTEQSSHLKRVPWGAVQTAIALKIKFQKLRHKERRQDASIPKPPTIHACGGAHTKLLQKNGFGGADMKKKTPLTLLGNTAAIGISWPWQPAVLLLRLSKTFLCSWHESRSLSLRLHEG